MLSTGRAANNGGEVVRPLRLPLLLSALLCLSLYLGLPDSLGASQDPYPRRIISLGPAITERLFILGVEDRIVGVTIYCRRPERAALKEKVGNVTHVSVEKILRLKPDLVLATALTDVRLVRRLRRFGIRTEIFPEPKSFEEMNQEFVRLGRIVGREGEADGVASLARRKVKGLSDRVANEEKPRVFCQIGAQPLFAAVGDTLLNDFIERANGVNIAKAARIGFYNREEVIRQNPDVIIIVTMGIPGDREKRAWQRFRSINAVRDGRVFILDAYKTCSPTPLTFADALAEIAAILHPESALQAGCYVFMKGWAGLS